MTSEIIGRANNYIPPTYLYINDNIDLKFCKLMKNILGRIWMETKKAPEACPNIFFNKAMNHLGHMTKFLFVFRNTSRPHEKRFFWKFK